MKRKGSYRQNLAEFRPPIHQVDVINGVMSPYKPHLLKALKKIILITFLLITTARKRS